MAEFFHMGGYALYVWGSLGMTFIVLLLNIVLPLQQHRDVLRKAAEFHEVPHPPPPRKGRGEKGVAS